MRSILPTRLMDSSIPSTKHSNAGSAAPLTILVLLTHRPARHKFRPAGR